MSPSLPTSPASPPLAAPLPKKPLVVVEFLVESRSLFADCFHLSLAASLSLVSRGLSISVSPGLSVVVFGSSLLSQSLFLSIILLFSLSIYTYINLYLFQLKKYNPR